MQKRTEPSLKINMILNIIRNVMGIMFPIITFPYISRVLGADNIGKFNFSQSIVSYFILIAGLGISPYAIREGAKIRNDKEKTRKLVSELLTINIGSTIIAYLILAIVLLTIPKLINYQVLIVILSLQIMFKTIGVEWIYSVYEDYTFTTIRSILIQFISLILMFAFVRNSSDLLRYTYVVVLASCGAEIVNFVCAKKYCKYSLTRHLNLRTHLKPIVTLFAMSAAVMIYVSMDITILGFMCNDYTVGIYSVSVKVYTILKCITSAALVVFIPRISFCIENNKGNRINSIATDAYNMMITFLLPVAIGIFVLRKEIVAILGGAEYANAITSLSILCGALVFCLLAGYWSQVILIPFGEERLVLKITVISAITNLVLNIILIPIWKENAAALTTLVSEFLVFIYCYIHGRNLVRLKFAVNTTIKVSAGCLPIIAVSVIVRLFHWSMINNIIAIVICSIASFFIIEYILKNNVVLDLIVLLRNNIRGQKKKG